MTKSVHQIVRSNATYHPQWDCFVHQNDGDIQQTSVWLANHVKQSERICLLEGDEIIAGCQMIEHHYPIIGKFGVVEFGPCFKNDRTDVYQKFVESVKHISAKKKLRYLAVIPDYDTEELVDCLQRNNFNRKTMNFPPNPTVRSTLIIDLQPSLDEIMGQMKKTRRKGIRKGLSSPVTYQLGGRDDIPIFYQLLLDTCIRRNAKPVIQSMDTLYRMWDNLAPNNWIVLHLAFVNEQPVCGALGIICGQTYKSWLWGWNGQYSEYCISETMYWKAMVWAKNNGCRWCDLLHVDTISACAIASSELIPDEIKSRTHFGSTQNKMQYGGTLVHYPDIYYYFPRKVDYLIFHVLGNRMMKLKYIKRIAAVIRGRNKMLSPFRHSLH